MRVSFYVLCLISAPVWGAESAVVLPNSADLFVDGDYAEVVEIPEDAAPAEVEAASVESAEQPMPEPTVVEPVVEEPPPAPAAPPSVTPEPPPVPDVVARDMPPDELAALESEKPEATPDVMIPPEGMAPIESYLEPIYAALSKRTPDGDWVTCQFKQPLVPRDRTQVAVLGYHDFSNTKSTTEMRMKTAEFCRQMQFLKDSDICVISMQDFLEWRFGTRCLPARCVLITIDDGWKSVYTDAYPVLKAYGYPFTLFVYVRYIGVQGASMTRAQLDEMRAHGATIGSHSWNHLYPSKWKRYQQTSVEYAAQLQTEIIESREKLVEWFGRCSTYCYPGGYHTAPMRASLKLAHYQAAFTVIEKKVTFDVTPYQVNRYMVFGIDTAIFRRAVNFDGKDGVDATIVAINNAETPARLFFPQAFVGVDSPLVQNEKTAAQKAADAAAAAEASTKESTEASTEEATVAPPTTEPLPESAPATPNPQNTDSATKSSPTENSTTTSV